MACNSQTIATADSSSRRMIFHNHIFKNAGTSVDTILESNFDGRWISREFPTDGDQSNARLVGEFVSANARLLALSTHTGDWRLDSSEWGIEVLPIVFVRHPIVRIESAYLFERRQIEDTYGTFLARRNDFAGYVRARLDDPNDEKIQNFQARRLSSFVGSGAADLETRAFKAIELLPFIGVVERFAASAAALEDYVGKFFPTFSAAAVRANSTDVSRLGAAERLERIKGSLGSALYERLWAENSIDAAVYAACGGDLVDQTRRSRSIAASSPWR